MGMFGSQKQVVISIGQDRRLKRISKEVFGEWLRDKKIQGAWYILRKLFVPAGFLAGKMCLVIDERFALPLNPYYKYPDEDLTKITELDGEGCRADQALDETQDRADKDSNKNILNNGLVVIVAGLVVCVIILALLVASGRI